MPPPPPRAPAAAARPTHFLCVPLGGASSPRPGAAAALREALGAFRADVTGPASLGGFGVPPAAVRPPGTLHLTLGVMTLAGPADVDRAAALLRSLRPREMLAARAAAGSGPGDGAGAELSVTLRGLRSMQARAEEATVLYAPPVDESGALRAFCEGVRAEFARAGLIRDARELLLHATVVNTVYAEGGGGGGGGGGRGGGRRGGGGRLVVPHAREIMDRYEDYVWLEGFPVRTLALCRMGAKPTVVDGEEDEAYEVESEVSF